MKRFKLILALAVVVLTGMSAFAINLDGKHYQGIAKIKGKTVDCWVNMEFDDSDVEFNIANDMNFASEYTVIEKAGTVNVKTNISGKPVVFTSSDGGATFQGSFSRMGQDLDLWVLEIPKKLVASNLSASELNSIVGSQDGYTSFITVGLENGLEMCVTSDFVLSEKEHTYKMTCDSELMQNIFSTMQGTYSIDGSTIRLIDSSGKTANGTIYDDGNYIKIPMGSASGMTLALILIR